ncbi:glycosyltransferase family 2 protein [Lacticaseibacillus suilingensis]|uniref:glycosyltransferase family 2 protein n=1 Tax=Lacticaseibacillus suilingensis TaxID=2799577 RepID=UPI0022E70FAD|nr:glycosyltransferase family 2 protein [Lacticaseibacillus suilingensis]
MNHTEIDRLTDTDLKVSFIIPIFNIKEELIERCVNSIINQTCSDFEIILVDDGSEEMVAHSCDRLAKKYNNSQIVVVHQINAGLSGARNAGVLRATGQYITFVDPDDWISATFIESLYPRDSNFPDVVLGKIQKDYPKKQFFYSYPFSNGERFDRNDRVELLKHLLDYDSHIYDAPGKIIRRDVILKYQIFHDPKLSQGAEGLEFNFRLFLNISNCVFEDKFVYHYCYTQDSITTTPSEKNDKLIVACFMKIYHEIESDPSIKEEEKADLKKCWVSRLNIAVSAILIGSIFHPQNDANWRMKKLRALNLKSNEAYRLLQTIPTPSKNIGIARTLTLYLFKKNLYPLINLISRIRYEQKRILSR